MALSYGFCLGEKDSQYTSRQFSEAIASAIGDGVTEYGGKLEVKATTGMTLSVATGFALAAGRWLKNDEQTTLTVQPADNHYDRYDAVVVRADEESKTVALMVQKGAAKPFPRPYQPVRDGGVYEIVLCSILVRVGVTQILQSNITDTRGDAAVCGCISRLQGVANDVLYIYNFLTSGIDKIVADLERKADAIRTEADEAIEEITYAMQQADVTVPVGDVQIFLDAPTDPNWLACDGSPVPPAYPALAALIGDTLPAIPAPARFAARIYAGQADPPAR